ncbi:MAG: hypothetical protein ACK4QP_04815 [Pseudorhizobium sp.]
MSSVAFKVLSTVNAPYGTKLSAEQLALKTTDFASVENFAASAFSFYSEVKADLQCFNVQCTFHRQRVGGSNPFKAKKAALTFLRPRNEKLEQ